MNPGLVPEEALLVINIEVITLHLFALPPPCNVLQFHLVDPLGPIRQSKVKSYAPIVNL